MAGGLTLVSGGLHKAVRALSPRRASRFDVLLDDNDLQIQASQGGAADAVIVFNSLHAKMAGFAPAEFAGAASDNGARPVVFVTDPTRRWFQGAGVAERIIDVIGGHLARIGAAPRLTMGTSMGGYGAAVFARALGAKAALAIGAQFDVGPEAEEDKWREERAAIDAFRLGPAGDHIDGAARITTVHGRRDRWHSTHFARLPGVISWIGPIGPHNIAMPLKNAGLLRPLTEAAFAMDDARIAELMTGFGARRKPVGKRFLRRHQQQGVA